MIVKYNPIPAGMICVCLLTNFDAGCKSKYNLIRNIQSFICLHFHYFINTYYKNKIKIRFWFISVTSPYPPLISVRWNVYIQTEWRNPLILVYFYYLYVTSFNIGTMKRVHSNWMKESSDFDLFLLLIRNLL